MKRERMRLRAIFGVLTVTVSALTARAQVGPPPDYAGDFWTRSTLTGDWGGLRNELATKGMTFDLSATQAEMGVLNGGGNEKGESAGRSGFFFHPPKPQAGVGGGGWCSPAGGGEEGVR